MKRLIFGMSFLVTLMIGYTIPDHRVEAQTSTPRYYYTPYVADGPMSGPYAELIKLEQKAQELAIQLRVKPDASKEAELKKIVEESFDKGHAAQVAEAKVLAEKLAKMQELLKKREEKKSDIVSRRVKQLMGEADDLEWRIIPAAPSYPVPPAPPLSVPSSPATSYRVDVMDPFAPTVSGAKSSAETLRPVTGQPMMATPPTIALPGPTAPTNPALPTIPAKPANPAKPASEKPASSSEPEDVKTLEIQLKLAMIKLDEVAVTLKHNQTLKENRVLSDEEFDKSRFAVDKAKLEVELAARRLEIAKEKENPAKRPAADSTVERPRS